MQVTGPRRKNRPGSIFFICVLVFSTLVLTPIYIHQHGISRSEAALFIFYVLATSFSITVGYHRLFSHGAFKANYFVQFLILFFGAAAFEQSALKWSSLHRRHHQYVDTDLDPYNIKRGFFYAHVGWILFWKQPVNYDNVKDLQKNPLVMHQHEHYRLWSLTAGLGVPLLVGALTGHLLGAALLSIGARLFIVLNSAFFINSYAHTFGSRDFDPHSSARDHWLGAVLTNGEGYHNYHHRFPIDYRNGVYWHHWDPSKWMIWILVRLGLAWDPKTIPDTQINEARAAARISHTQASQA